MSELLAARGAVVVDADAIAREVVEPGTPGYEAVVARFGPDIVKGGRLDRPALAQIVFNDERARRDLNDIVHPLIRQRTAEQMSAAGREAIVVCDVPLLVESRLADGFDMIVIVEASRDTRLNRLEFRGMRRSDAIARMAAQASDEQRRAVADEIVRNDGTREDLEAAVAALWQRLVAR